MEMTSRRCAPAASGDEAELLLDAMLEAGFSGSIPVTGEEMSPVLVPDDRVIVTPCLGLPCPGQMVTARYQGRVVVRRLVAVRMAGGRRRYRLEADAGPAQGFEVLREDLLGRPAAILRRGLLQPLCDDDPCRRRPPHRKGTG